MAWWLYRSWTSSMMTPRWHPAASSTPLPAAIRQVPRPDALQGDQIADGPIGVPAVLARDVRDQIVGWPLPGPGGPCVADQLASADLVRLPHDGHDPMAQPWPHECHPSQASRAMLVAGQYTPTHSQAPCGRHSRRSWTSSTMTPRCAPSTVARVRPRFRTCLAMPRPRVRSASPPTPRRTYCVAHSRRTAPAL